jgi:hypothetical protein
LKRGLQRAKTGAEIRGSKYVGTPSALSPTLELLPCSAPDEVAVSSTAERSFPGTSAVLPGGVRASASKAVNSQRFALHKQNQKGRRTMDEWIYAQTDPFDCQRVRDTAGQFIALLRIDRFAFRPNHAVPAVRAGQHAAGGTLGVSDQLPQAYLRTGDNSSPGLTITE